MKQDMTQQEMILYHIKQYGSISPLEAMKQYGIMRLASRIHDLKKQGYVFNREVVTTKNRFGEPVRFVRYSLHD